ncbi:MAG: hypothetical protein ABSA18_05925 [Dehalococcoidia bacterium]
MTIELKIDYRLGGIPAYRLVVGEDNLMQIPDEIRKCVVFVCFKDIQGIKLAGTAFLVGVSIGEGASLIAPYFITAKHVIDGIRKASIDQKVYIRINLKNTGAQLVETPIERWLLHPSEPNVDVAVFNWVPPQEIFDYRFIPLEMSATQEIINKENIGVGDDIFLTGLFQNHYGSQRNIPIIRVGNIAAMPEEKVHTRKMGDIDAYLIEARSLGGFSGSPVFAYIGSLRRFGDSMQLGHSKFTFYLLGLMHGHFDLEYTELDNVKEDNLYNLQVNIGIAIVVPIWKIIEVINQEAFVNARNLALKQAQEKISPILDNTTKTINPESN